MKAKKKGAQGEIRELVSHDTFLPSHRPPHDPSDCKGCDGARWRGARNKRKARMDLDVKLTGRDADTPARTCAGCSAPVYAGRLGSIPEDRDLGRPKIAGRLLVWGWNQDIDRAHWSVESRLVSDPPHTYCPRCRKLNEQGSP